MNFQTISNAFGEFLSNTPSNNFSDVVDSQALSKVYLAYLGRPPDQSELSLYANGPQALAIADIVASPEASQFLRVSSDSLDERVTGVYTQMFGRRAASEEVSYWVGELEAGRVSSDQLALAVLNGAQGEDAQVISNKLKVIESFTSRLTINSDFATAYVGNSSTNSLRGFLSDVGSDEASLDAALSLVSIAVDLIITNKDVSKTEVNLSITDPEGLVSVLNIQSSPFTTNSMTEVSGLDDFLADSRFSSITGKGQTIAIIDSSFDLDHPAFGPDANGDGVGDRILHHADFTPERNGANTLNTYVDDHGTHVASIAAGQLSEARGIAPGANLVLLQGLGEDGSGSDGNLQQALQWVVSNASFYNIVAVNNSWGGSTNNNLEVRDRVYNDEFGALARLGVVPLVAAGNDYAEYQAQGVGGPADDAFAFGVSSSNGSRRLLSSFSQRSETLSDIVAPGSNILAANSGGGTISISGTSMASPVAAGAVALAQELAQATLGRRLTVDEVYSVLQSGASRFVDSEVASDGVTNSGGTYRHIDLKAMGEAVLALGSGAPAPTPPVDTVGGGDGDDSLDGGDGNDVIEDSDGDDFLDGGDGNDAIEDSDGGDFLDGDDGGDFLDGDDVVEDGDGETYRDDLEAANVILAGQTTSGELESAGERDVFVVDLEANRVYEITLTGDTLFDPYLRVFNPDGTLLAENDDGDDGLNSALNLLVPETGSYYVVADSYLSIEAGTYSLEISSGTAAPESGVRMFSVASSDRVIPGEITYGGALDSYTVELSVGMLYTFSLRGADSGVGTLVDPYLELFLNDEFVNFSDDSGDGRDSKINFIPAVSGTYTLVASDYSLTESGSYVLQISSEVYNGPPEVAGNISTQASLSDSSSVSGEINYQFDEDWFRVELQAGNQYSFALTGLSDSLLILLDSSGHFVSFDDDGGDGTDSLLRFVPPSDGTYYISAGGYADGDTGTYSLSMSSQIATEDSVSNVKQVGPLTLGTPANGVIADEEGYDVYTITLSPGEYRVTVQPGSGDDPLEDPLVFIDEDQFFLDGLFDDDGGTELDSLAEFTIAESMDAVIAVGGYDPGSYTLLIQAL
jgi:hypothetical protein